MLQAPFPYFGGKSWVAPEVWEALGQPRVYLEPFFGSGAVLLARPNYNPKKYIEAVCDKDGFVCNVWRALQYAPDEVARWCDWPVNQIDLRTRRRELIESRERLILSLSADDHWYDAQIAGYWIWVASCWIGGEFIGPGDCDRRPSVHAGAGVHKTRLRELPDDSLGVQELYAPQIYGWFRRLSNRLRYVRVATGDWSSICGEGWLAGPRKVGAFLDPPYGVPERSGTIYLEDSRTVSSDVQSWCIKHGGKPWIRIVLAGYYEEHKVLLDHGWTVKMWVGPGGYALQGRGDTRGKRRRFQEALFYSPHCNSLREVSLW